MQRDVKDIYSTYKNDTVSFNDNFTAPQNPDILFYGSETLDEMTSKIIDNLKKNFN